MNSLITQVNQKDREIKNIQRKYKTLEKNMMNDKIEHLEKEKEELEKCYFKNLKQNESLSQKNEIILLESIKNIENSKEKNLNNMKDIIKEKEERFEEVLQLSNEKFKDRITIYKTLYETQIFDMQKTFELVHKIAISGQDSLNSMKNIDKDLELIHEELSKAKNIVEENKKKLHRIEFEIERIEKEFYIKLGQYKEANKKKALRILRDMLKLDKDYNMKNMGYLKSKRLLEKVEKNLKDIVQIKSGLKEKKYDLFIELNQKFNTQENLLFNQEERNSSKFPQKVDLNDNDIKLIQ